ncbi:MAG: flagellar hook-basal body complex protein FliE [Betaproteobacteria bacterium]|nr:flagellar hook-basal body complex protein FliE [Betaproteobacteria bacterium]
MSAAQAGSSNGLAGLGGLQGGLPTGGLRRASGAALQREVMLENPKVSLEETMVAMQRAQISFQSALHIRNRMMQAYTDIMNMQV